ncbi:MAG: AMP-binding protein [Pseudomonadota bacterium]
MNLSQIIEKSSNRFPDKIALLANDYEITYSELATQIARLASVLQQRGMEKGDRVAIALPNRPEFVVAYFAVIHAGGVAVTLNPSATAYELNYYLNDSGAKIFITCSRKAHLWEELKGKVPAHTIIVCDGKSDSFEQLIASAQPMPAVDVAPSDPAVIIYTSAMQGFPLGALLSHHNLIGNAEAIRAFEGIDSEDRSLAVIPLFHAFGATLNMLSMMKYGGSIALVERYEKERFPELLEKYRITYMGGVPLMYLTMLENGNARKYDLSSVRLFYSGGCAAPLDMVPRFQERFGICILDGYGLTEAAPIVTSNRMSTKEIKNGSVGLPIPGCAIKILDNSGVECKTSEIGEVMVSGPNLMLGYFKKPEATSTVLNKGWLDTGDIGYLDEDGFLFLTGRTKEMIITNGLNIYPKEVEKVIRMYPDVEDAVVFGRPDLMNSELAHAFVVKKSGNGTREQEIIKFLKIYLAPYKIPRTITFVDNLPLPMLHSSTHNPLTKSV